MTLTKPFMIVLGKSSMQRPVYGMFMLVIGFMVSGIGVFYGENNPGLFNVVVVGFGAILGSAGAVVEWLPR